MSENISKDAFGQMIDGLDKFITSKTVVGEPIKADDAVIIPLIDVSSGMAIGSFNKDKGSSAGGLFSKMTPSAVLVVQNGGVKLINLKSTDAISKAIDMIPDLIDKITGKHQVTPKAVKKARDIVEGYKTENE